MKRIVILLLLAALAPFVAGEDDFIFDHSLYSASSVTVDVLVENTIRLQGNVQQVNARLYYYPKDRYATQRVRNIINDPTPTEHDDHLLFSWNNPSQAVTFSHQSTVTSEFDQPRITEPIEFPYEFIPPEMSRYLGSEEIIRITPEIRRKAEEIIGEETDAVRIAFLLGSWVKEHIEYDLSSVALEASMPSDWVLENREGVCDELTSLFMAMLRSQGIPARFVSGVAYTNLEILDTNWGPHGWAEVWFPDVGWAPYDVTYGQYGFVDATHIAIQKTPDAASNAAEYGMRSRGASFEPQPLSRTFTLQDRGAQRQADIDIDITPALEHTGFGSYNRVDVEVRNRRNYYVSADLHFSRTNQLTSELETKSILLEPGERRTYYWYMRVDDDLQSGFQYTFSLMVNSNVGEAAENTFRVTQQGVVAERSDIAIDDAQRPQGLAPELECDYLASVRQGQEFTVECTYPEVVELCMTECSEGTVHTETFRFDRLGAHTTTATATRGQASTQRVLTFLIIDDPALNISSHAPSTIDFGEELALTVTLKKTSLTDPEDVTITLSHPLFDETFSVEQLQSQHLLEVRIPTNQLQTRNTFTLTAEYDTPEGERSASTTVDVRVQPQTFFDRLTLSTNTFFGWVAGLF